MADAKAFGWKSRIVRTGESAAGQLLANPANWRIHPVEQQEALRGLIGHELGWVQSVIVNLRTAKAWPAGERGVETLLDGHARVQVALQQGEETPVPTTWIDLTPAEERLFLATFDPIAGLAVSDDAKYGELVAALPEVEIDLSAVLHEPRAARDPDKTPTRFSVVVECRTKRQQERLLKKLAAEGYRCRGMAS